MKKVALLFSILFLLTIHPNNIFAQGFKIKKKKGKYGLVQKKTKTVIIPFEYDEIKDSKRKSYSLRKENKWGLADERGKILLPVEYDEISWEIHMQDIFTVKKDNKWGLFIGQTLRVPTVFDTIYQFGLNYFVVIKNDKIGLFDNYGVEVFPPIYEALDHFDNDRGLVKKEGKWLQLIGNEEQIYTEDVVFRLPEVYPAPQGCSTDFNKGSFCISNKIQAFILENFEYPEEALKEGVGFAGVHYEVTIDKDGSLKNITITKDKTGHFGDIVVKALEQMPKWQPGKQDGKNVVTRVKSAVILNWK